MIECKYCDKKLLIANVMQHENSCMYNPVNYNTCKQCSKQISPNRKFCNRSCSASFNNNIPKRTRTGKTIKCKGCDLEIYRRPGEIQEFCTKDCRKKYLWTHQIKLIESNTLGCSDYHGATQDALLKKYLIEKYGEKCMDCGWNTQNAHTQIIPVQLDHKDGNPQNQHITNLHLLCPNCHSLTKYFGSRGNGREWRKN